MSKVRKRWLYAGAAVTTTVVAGLFIAATVLSRRFEPFIREQAIEYMSERFDSEVQIAALRIKMPKLSPINVLLNRGKGATARVEGQGISMRYRNAPDLPQLFSINKFILEVDLGTLFEDVKTVNFVRLDGMSIFVPPKGERKPLGDGRGARTKIRSRARRGIQSPDSKSRNSQRKIDNSPQGSLKDSSRILSAKSDAEVSRYWPSRWTTTRSSPIRNLPDRSTLWGHSDLGWPMIRAIRA